MSVIFKSTFMGGYDKEDVQAKYAELENELEKIKAELKAEQERHKEDVLELKTRVRTLEMEKVGLEREIRDTYQPYKDNYDSISKLVYQSQIQAERIQTQAKDDCEAMRRSSEAECEKIHEEAVRASEALRKESEAEAEKRIAAADTYLKKYMSDFHKDMDNKLEDARESYRAVFSELVQLTEVLDGTQKSFREVFRKVHDLKEEMEASAQNMESFQPIYPSEEQVLQDMKKLQLKEAETPAETPDEDKSVPDQEVQQEEAAEEAAKPEPVEISKEGPAAECSEDPEQVEEAEQNPLDNLGIIFFPDEE